MSNGRFQSPSESRGIFQGGLVPLGRRVVGEANPHFPQKMYAPGEVFGC